MNVILKHKLDSTCSAHAWQQIFSLLLESCELNTLNMLDTKRKLLEKLVDVIWAANHGWMIHNWCDCGIDRSDQTITHMHTITTYRQIVLRSKAFNSVRKSLSSYECWETTQEAANYSTRTEEKSVNNIGGDSGIFLATSRPPHIMDCYYPKNRTWWYFRSNKPNVPWEW